MLSLSFKTRATGLSHPNPNHTTALTCSEDACHAFLPPALGFGLMALICDSISIVHPSLFHGGTPGRSEGGMCRGGQKGVEGLSQLHTVIPPSATANTAEKFRLVRVNENIVYIVLNNMYEAYWVKELQMCCRYQPNNAS